MLKNDLKKLVLNADIKIGLNEMTQLTGASVSQIHYWEKRGYIYSIQDRENRNHYYSLKTVYQAYTIKYFLDQGYTLKMAAQKGQERKIIGDLFFTFVQERIFSITPTGEETGEISLGPLADHPDQEVIAKVNTQGQAQLVLRDKPTNHPA